MPIYVYYCPDCNRIGDFTLPYIHEKPKCEKCGKEMVQKFTPTNFQFSQKFLEKADPEALGERTFGEKGAKLLGDQGWEQIKKKKKLGLA